MSARTARPDLARTNARQAVSAAVRAAADLPATIDMELAWSKASSAATSTDLCELLGGIAEAVRIAELAVAETRAAATATATAAARASEKASQINRDTRAILRRAKVRACVITDTGDIARTHALAEAQARARSAKLTATEANAAAEASQAVHAAATARAATLSIAATRVNDLARMYDTVEDHASSGSADKLLTVAAGLLPTADRARYAEEYRSELWEIARAGVGRLPQIRYAMGQLTRATRMRAAVKAHHRRSTAP